MSAWASFEAFVRVYSELLAKTVPNLPVAVRQGLLETVEVLDEGGRIQKLSKRQRLLTRYWWLLKYGYGVEYDKGSRIWQMGREALRKRNALVHYELSDMPSVKATELCGHLEAILLLLIGPSTQAKRSVMPDQYELHGMLDQLRPLTEEYEERPFFKDIPVSLREVIFDCPFENVDATRFPTFRQQTRGSES